MNEQSDYVFHFHATRRIGKALFGDEYIYRLTHRELWLLDEYGLIDHDDGASRPEEDYSEYHLRPSVNDEGLARIRELDLAEFASAWRRLRFRQWQDRAVSQWLEDRAILPFDAASSFSLDRTKFEVEFKRAFPREQVALKDDEAAQVMEEATRRTGAPRVYDWDAAYRYIISIANSVDGLPEKQSELIEQVAQWFECKYQKQPGASVLKERITAIYKQLPSKGRK